MSDECPACGEALVEVDKADWPEISAAIHTANQRKRAPSDTPEEIFEEFKKGIKRNLERHFSYGDKLFCTNPECRVISVRKETGPQSIEEAE